MRSSWDQTFAYIWRVGRTSLGRLE